MASFREDQPWTELCKGPLRLNRQLKCSVKSVSTKGEEKRKKGGQGLLLPLLVLFFCFSSVIMAAVLSLAGTAQGLQNIEN